MKPNSLLVVYADDILVASQKSIEHFKRELAIEFDLKDYDAAK